MTNGRREEPLTREGAANVVLGVVGKQIVMTGDASKESDAFWKAFLLKGNAAEEVGGSMLPRRALMTFAKGR